MNCIISINCEAEMLYFKKC